MSQIVQSPSLVVSLVVAAALSACGGGGGGEPSAVETTLASTPSSTADAPAAPAAAAAVQPAAAASASTDADADADAAIAAELLSASADPAATTEAPPVRYELEGNASETAAPTEQALAAATPAAPTATGRVFYVDSRYGADANNGTAATAAAGGSGPWKTLAKLASTTLTAGDTVYLACGSVWKETLKLSGNGASGNPINVSAYPAACSNKPVIDGSSAIAAGAWTVHAGNVYRASLATAPHALFGSAGRFDVAHHPNRGFDSSLPASLYLRNAVDSNSVTVGGKQASTYVTTGTDLKLPAGAAITVGTPIRVRVNSWVLDETTVSAVSGNRLSLAQPTDYPVKAGWGFFLMGQPWMVDSAGEWAYDASAKVLYAWMPNSQAPTAIVYAATLDTGIDLQGRSYVTIDGVSVMRVKTGINMRSTAGVTIRRSSLQDIDAKGIDAAASTSATIDGNVITRTGTDAVSMTDDASVVGTLARITNNDVSNAGVVFSGETIIGLPHTASAGIRAGTRATVTGNVVRNTGRMGIWPMAGSLVDRNFVTGACAVLDDCGGIYTSGTNNNGTISNNIVTRSRGAIEGKPTAVAYTQAQGIYLDESAAGVTVTGNTVTEADNGIQIHVAANNTIANNKLYGNRKSQIWLQETRNVVKSTGDVFGNVIKGNSIVPTSPTAKSVLQETLIATTTAFASYDLNRYFDRLYTRMAYERTPSVEQEYTFDQWQAATTSTGTPRNLDPAGYGASEQLYASYTVAGSNVVPNANFASTLTGWTTWNQAAPYGALLRVGCFAGYCGQYTAVATPSLLSSPNFTIRKDQWYRLSVDVLAGSDNQLVQMFVRRGGGGSNGFEALSNVSMNIRPGKAWKRFTVLFQGTKTVNANDPVTLDKGARLDFQTSAGHTITVANIEIVPTTSADATTRTNLLLNTGATATQAACPVAATAPASCAMYFRFADDAPVTWPYYLAPLSSEIVYTRDTRLIDADGDGIPDSQDGCPSTGAGLAVNARGCAINQ